MSAPAPGERPLLIVIDPVARRDDAESVRIVRDVLCAGASAKVCLPDGPEDMARHLAHRGRRHPVVVGDDLALRRIVGLLHRERELADAALAFVPVGASARSTALARELGVPLGAAPAARVVLEGRERRLDLLIDDSDGVVIGGLSIPGRDGGFPGRTPWWQPALRGCRGLVRGHRRTNGSAGTGAGTARGGPPPAARGGGRGGARGPRPAGAGRVGDGVRRRLRIPAGSDGAVGAAARGGTGRGGTGPAGTGSAGKERGARRAPAGTVTDRPATAPLPVPLPAPGRAARRGTGPAVAGLPVRRTGAGRAGRGSRAPGGGGRRPGATAHGPDSACGGLAHIVIQPVDGGRGGAPVTAHARAITVSGADFHYRADAVVGGPVRTRTWTVRPGALRLTLPHPAPPSGGS
ncbi:diacylglycerol kinase [Streptomyces sp. MNU89]|uniref:diacylglycerol kinase n=1 Tax=Streptomyces sp. MNU89 TaxID=2560025 RepID=UPI001E415539|nr:diacylglycerol kinase [Streptomyces sp. MNU89]